MADVTLSDMRDKLLTLDQVSESLAQTEPLASIHIDNDSGVKFRLADNWESALDAKADTSVVDAYMTVAGTEYQMTKGAALQAAANVGLPGVYVRKTPGALIEPQLDYHYTGGLGSTEYNALAVGDVVSAFTKPTIRPFSNLSLLERAVSAIQSQYGDDTEILADYKYGNTLARTDVRLIIPQAGRIIENTNMNDMPGGAEDEWCAGIHFSNSAIGKGFTAFDAYLFRWWCTNGATENLESVGTWSRRTNGQEDDVYAWARDAVEEVLGGMEHRFDQVQALANTNLSGNVQDVLRQLFTEYGVPVTQRAQIMEALHGIDGEITLYHVMQALTRLANDPHMSPSRVDRIMRIGGSLPTQHFDTTKARVWAEGHEAEEDSNPYEVIIGQ